MTPAEQRKARKAETMKRWHEANRHSCRRRTRLHMAAMRARKRAARLAELRAMPSLTMAEVVEWMNLHQMQVSACALPADR